MEPSKPPLVCYHCGHAIEDRDDAMTLGIHEGDRSGGWVFEELGVFHFPCWEVFEWEHRLRIPSRAGSDDAPRSQRG
jgi:hypothetical protein